MKLRELLEGLPYTPVTVDLEQEISGVSYDSRRIQPGEAFVAIPGAVYDGHAYLAQARQRGAVCALCSHPAEGLPYVLLPDTRQALAQLAANFFHRPDRALCLVGITGTNGKSSVAWLTAALLERCMGTQVGLMGTGGCRIAGRSLTQERTTPEAWDVQRLLRQMVDAGCSHAVMEVSSHALALERVRGLDYALAAFTNLSREHLDFHGSMERYCADKGRLFHQCRQAVVNRDDPWTTALLSGCSCPVYGYGLERGQLRAENVVLSPEDVGFTVREGTEAVETRLRVPGRFSVYNALAALGICRRLGVPLREAAGALAELDGAPGRMEPFEIPGRGVRVLIDFAHTPAALEQALQAARPGGAGRLIVVFGCGGERDRGKRPLMGAAAARYADMTVLTDDNPRREDPAAIIRDILPGLGAGPYRVIPDRREAIRFALSRAGDGDVVLLCGKGRENFQERAGQRLPLDERDILAEYAAECAHLAKIGFDK